MVTISRACRTAIYDLLHSEVEYLLELRGSPLASSAIQQKLLWLNPSSYFYAGLRPAARPLSDSY